MAKSHAPDCLDGGYQAEFVESIPEALSCPICLLPFRDPHLVSCCGTKFCKSCISRVKTANQPCPLCKQEFNTMLERSIQRRVLGLKVRCSRNKDGCQWMGELRHLDDHEREVCGWAVVECIYQCGAHLPRRLMDEHENDECSQRPMGVKLDSFMRKMEDRFEKEIKKMEDKQKAERERCEREMETKLLTEREQHEKAMEKMENKLMTLEDKLTAESERYEKEIVTMKEKMERIERIKIEYLLGEAVPQGTISLPFEFVMTNYSTRKLTNAPWYSPPFYTHRGGFKACICITVGSSSSSSSGSYVYARAMQLSGEYDSQQATCSYVVKIQLLNHKKYDDTICDVGLGINVYYTHSQYCGGCQIITHTDVESSDAEKLYLINDCLTWRVINCQPYRS